MSTESHPTSEQASARTFDSDALRAKYYEQFDWHLPDNGNAQAHRGEG